MKTCFKELELELEPRTFAEDKMAINKTNFCFYLWLYFVSQTDYFRN